MLFRYTLSWEKLSQHHIHVRMLLSETSAQQKLKLPNWIPGSYMIREFAKHIQGLRCYNTKTEQVLSVRKIDKSTWEIDCLPGYSITIEYDVYAFDLSVRTAYVDGQRVFFNPSSLCLYDPQQRDQACELELVKQGLSSSWIVATGLCPTDIDMSGFGLYRASTYDDLIDHPFEISNSQIFTFQVLGITHRLVISGKLPLFDEERLIQDISKVCLQQHSMWGGPAPFEHYTFLLYAGGKDVYGGLEHHNSSANMIDRQALPKRGESITKPGKLYTNLLALLSHEYFHAWNVKKIRPKRFAPYQLQQENYTHLLWAFEGITAYYDQLMLCRCGVISIEQYLEMLAEDYSKVLRVRGWQQQTLEEASFDAWIKFYHPNENSVNVLNHYYVQGSLMAMALDASIRQRSEQQKSLDDVLRFLWQGEKHEVGEEEWEQLAEQATGLSLGDVFEKLLRQRIQPDCSEAFAYFGLICMQGSGPLDYGIKFQPEAGGLRLLSVRHDSAAAKAGLWAQDLLVAVDSLKIQETWDGNWSHVPVGSSVRIHYFRRDELHETDLLVTEPPAETIQLQTHDQEALLAWLGPQARFGQQ